MANGTVTERSVARQRICPQCQVSFKTKAATQECCSKRCAAQLKGDARRKHDNAPRPCELCEALFIPGRLNGASLRAKRVQTFCSNVCRHLVRSEIAAVKRAHTELLRVLLSRRECGNCRIAFVGKARFCSHACSLASGRVAPPERSCNRCARTFQPRWLPQVFCSKHCNRRAHHGEANNHRQRARRANVTYEPVSRLKVFERDRWRCQVCGSKAPKRLIGGTHDRAPELDHRVPLALGGPHTYANLQLACRKCNATKHDHSIRGQMNLFCEPLAA